MCFCNCWVNLCKLCLAPQICQIFLAGSTMKCYGNHQLTSLCTENELKCCMGLTLLSEGQADFWLCEFLDSLLPFSRWITALHVPHSNICMSTKSSFQMSVVIKPKPITGNYLPVRLHALCQFQTVVKTKPQRLPDFFQHSVKNHSMQIYVSFESM